jgi:hypothetical protein
MQIHGCIRCKAKGCKSWTCPICHPQQHRHNDCSVGNYSPYRIRPLPDLCNHDYQELQTVIVCKKCGKVIKK